MLFLVSCVLLWYGLVISQLEAHHCALLFFFLSSCFFLVNQSARPQNCLLVRKPNARCFFFRLVHLCALLRFHPVSFAAAWLNSFKLAERSRAFNSFSLHSFVLSNTSSSIFLLSCSFCSKCFCSQSSSDSGLVSLCEHISSWIFSFFFFPLLLSF